MEAVALISHKSFLLRFSFLIFLLGSIGRHSGINLVRLFSPLPGMTFTPFPCLEGLEKDLLSLPERLWLVEELSQPSDVVGGLDYLA